MKNILKFYIKKVTQVYKKYTSGTMYNQAHKLQESIKPWIEKNKIKS